LRTRVGEVKLEDCLDPRAFENWLAEQEITMEEIEEKQ